MENILALIGHQGQTIRQLSEQIVELVAKLEAQASSQDVFEFEDDELDAAIVTIAELEAIVAEREATIRERDQRIAELEAKLAKAQETIVHLGRRLSA